MCLRMCPRLCLRRKLTTSLQVQHPSAHPKPRLNRLDAHRTTRTTWHLDPIDPDRPSSLTRFSVPPLLGPTMMSSFSTASATRRTNGTCPRTRLLLVEASAIDGQPPRPPISGIPPLPITRNLLHWVHRRVHRIGINRSCPHLQLVNSLARTRSVEVSEEIPSELARA
jgi:hypothetical protein